MNQTLRHDKAARRSKHLARSRRPLSSLILAQICLLILMSLLINRCRYASHQELSGIHYWLCKNVLFSNSVTEPEPSAVTFGTMNFAHSHPTVLLTKSSLKSLLQSQNACFSQLQLKSKNQMTWLTAETEALKAHSCLRLDCNSFGWISQHSDIGPGWTDNSAHCPCALISSVRYAQGHWVK